MPVAPNTMSLFCRSARATYIARVTGFQRAELQNLCRFLNYKVTRTAKEEKTFYDALISSFGQEYMNSSAMPAGFYGTRLT